MAYCTQADVAALIPETRLTDGLDDAGTGEADAWSAVLTATENRINGILGARYTVPFDASGNAGLAALLTDAAVHIAASVIWKRRGKKADEFPFKAELEELIGRLRAIAAGTDPLSPKIERANAGAVIIGEDSRTASASLAV